MLCSDATRSSGRINGLMKILFHYLHLINILVAYSSFKKKDKNQHNTDIEDMLTASEPEVKWNKIRLTFRPLWIYIATVDNQQLFNTIQEILKLQEEHALKYKISSLSELIKRRNWLICLKTGFSSVEKIMLCCISFEQKPKI